VSLNQVGAKTVAIRSSPYVKDSLPRKYQAQKCVADFSDIPNYLTKLGWI
jgi:hypothetical protein